MADEPTNTDEGGEGEGEIDVGGLIRDIAWLLSKTEDRLKDYSKYLYTETIKSMASVSDYLDKQIKDGVNEVEKSFKDITSGISDSLSELKSVADDLYDNIGTLAGDVAQGFSDTIDLIKKESANVVGSLSAEIDSIGAFLSKQANDIFDSTIKFIDDTAKNIVDYIGKGIEAVGKAIEGIYNDLSKLIGSMTSEISEVVTTAFSNISQQVVSAFGTIADVFTDGIQFLAGMFDEFKNYLDSLFTIEVDSPEIINEKIKTLFGIK
jgi:phage-related protein